MIQTAIIFFVTIGLFLSGCRTTQPAPAPGTPASTAVQQGYALLYDTLHNESKVDGALLLRHPDPRVSALIKEIAKAADEGAKRIENLAKREPAFDLKSQGLPEIEVAARKRTSNAAAKSITGSQGKSFEFELLLTQYEGLNYARFLAEEIAEREDDDANKRFLTRLASDLKDLHDRVISLLKEPYVERGG